jgi:hypothetical protein
MLLISFRQFGHTCRLSSWSPPSADGDVRLVCCIQSHVDINHQLRRGYDGSIGDIEAARSVADLDNWLELIGLSEAVLIVHK